MLITREGQTVSLGDILDSDDGERRLEPVRLALGFCLAVGLDCDGAAVGEGDLEHVTDYTQ